MTNIRNFAYVFHIFRNYHDVLHIFAEKFNIVNEVPLCSYYQLTNSINFGSIFHKRTPSASSQTFSFPNDAAFYLFVNIVFSYEYVYQSICTSVIKLT